MRTRPRETLRLLAVLRHSARCRAIRAAADRQALDREDADAATEEAENTRDEARTPRLATSAGGWH